MMITPEYVELQKQLHATGIYGYSGHAHANIVRDMLRDYNTNDVLDYGCGHRGFETSLGFPIQNYDPCIDEFSAPPKPADIVVCTDVLEHIEPECLDEVLADLARLTKRAGFFVIHTGAAKKFLADGRNAHLTQAKFAWWEKKLKKHFFIVWHKEVEKGIAVIVGPQRSALEGAC